MTKYYVPHTSDTNERRIALALEASCRQSELSNLLQIEAQLSAQTQRMDRVAAETVGLAVRRMRGKEVYEEEVKSVSMQMDCALEGYFNVLDRLCACVLRGYLNEEEAKDDYREMLQGTIDAHAATYEISNEKRRNVYALAVRWGCITTTTGGNNE